MCPSDERSDRLGSMNPVACIRLRASAAAPAFPSRCRAAPQPPRSVSRLPPRASASTTEGIYLSSFLSLPSPHEQIQPFSSPFHLLNIRQFVTEAKIKVGRSPYLALPGPPPLSQGCFMSTTVDLQLDYERDPPIDDAKSLEKESTLNVAVSQLASDFDRESNLCLERFSRTRRASVIPTGSLKLDLALGIGGLPKGRMVEIFGKESSGKTTLALHVIKEAQKSGGCCAYIDAENAFDPSFAEAIGVDTEKLLIAQPDSAENSLSIVNTLVGGSIDVVVVDSVAALIPKCELEGEIHTNYGETQSRLMTRALRKIQYTLSRSETLIIFVNQVRTRRSSKEISGLYKEVACGGNALGFYAAIRVRTSRKELRYTDDQATGIGISVQIIKNKLAPAVLKEAGIDITFGKGIAYESEILEMASSHGVIVKEGCGYWINGEFLTDKAAAEKFLLENVTVADDICGTMRSQLFER